MGFRRRFEFGLAWRTALLVGALWLLNISLDTPDLRAGRVVAATTRTSMGTGLFAPTGTTCLCSSAVSSFG